jgi:hypothetical protein
MAIPEGVKKYKFLSPTIQIMEVDQSQIPKDPEVLGPVFIGRSERGPGMRPVKVGSFSEFVEIFGNPIGGGAGHDVWRDGNYLAPTYAAYAAQAWLKNASPATFVRLLGVSHPDVVSGAVNAGWYTPEPDTAQASTGGAYGLFIGDLSAPAGGDQGDAALAAIFYVTEGGVLLAGNSIGGNFNDAGNGVWKLSTGDDYEFRIEVHSADNTDGPAGDGLLETIIFNLDPNSKLYIRNVFNTNPTLTNSAITATSNAKGYWLGETYERFVKDTLTETTGQGSQIACIVALGSDFGYDGGYYEMDAQPPQTPWVFSQHLGLNTEFAIDSTTLEYPNTSKLFKFHGLYSGQWDQGNMKISFEDIKASSSPHDPYGSFSVVIRKSSDTDKAPVVIERFSSVNLNPNSEDYIARRIGDMYTVWDENETAYTEYGDYTNNSKFLRVEVNADLAAGALDPVLLPFGFYGPLRHAAVKCERGEALYLTGQNGDAADTDHENWAWGMGNDAALAAGNSVWGMVGWGAGADANSEIVCDLANFEITMNFPVIPLRSDTRGDNLSDPTDAYWGIETTMYENSNRFDPGYKDLVRPIPAEFSTFSLTAVDASGEGDDFFATEYMAAFTLDDVRYISGSTVHAQYVPGTRLAGNSLTVDLTDGYSAVLEAGFDRFTMPLFGGFEGLDITEKEPFRNTVLADESPTTHYAFNSVKRAIDAVSDAEVVECNMMAIPGITDEDLTSHLLDVCERRSDALAVIDLDGDYVPSTESTSSEANRMPDVDTTIANLRDRGINNSYGCAYFPWVQIRDTIDSSILWAPPSIVGVGTMAYSQRQTELWFAPAGFNRGGLSEGNAGIPVLNVRKRLKTKDRDKLYEANINPIAKFPQEGLVVYGQKTLQVTRSALDRINVRRLLLYIKWEIARAAKSILFDPNLEVTWNRFISKINPILLGVKSRFGLEEFRVILDETTTTPELQDRNLVYGKVYLKPAKAIEGIFIDAILTNSGAGFDD